jgi:succinoglycan biosynthesis protein ExoA
MHLVSVIVPCLNEESTIALLLGAIYQQNYPRNLIEVIIADGQSTDNTLAKIDRFSNDHQDLRVMVLTNFARTIPAALNLAIDHANGEFIIRLDGHSIPANDYIKNCVNNLVNGKGDNVGGCWDIRARSESWQSRSIAKAASHPLGVGDARYRIGGIAQRVDTVPFGAYRRDFIQRMGKYDESLHTNEDYELNVRIRKKGNVVWFDPAIRSTYLAAGTFRALIRQYCRYGYWKARMLQNHPQSIRWRQALPPVFVLSISFMLVLGFWKSLFWMILCIELSFYVIVLLTAGMLIASKERDISLLVGVPLAISIMHFSWGLSFLYGMIYSIIKPKWLIQKQS